jgi:hypothetical protein
MSEQRTPQVGEFWAGFTHEGSTYENLRRLEIIESFNNGKDFKVRYRKRGEGVTEGTTSECYLTDEWTSFKSAEKARRDERRYCQTMQEELHQAMHDAKAYGPAVSIYSSTSTTKIVVTKPLAEQLLAGLRVLNGKDSTPSSLERIFS